MVGSSLICTQKWALFFLHRPRDCLTNSHSINCHHQKVDISGTLVLQLSNGSFLEDSGAMSPTDDLSVCALSLHPEAKLESQIFPHLPTSYHHT